MLRLLPFIVLALLLTSGQVVAEKTLPTTVKQLRHELDVIDFELQGEARLQRLSILLDHSEILAKQHDKDAGFQMLAGFFNASYAGATGGLGALKYAKAARRYLEQSVTLESSIYAAESHAVLGMLYTKVPGWPVGFGNPKKALMNYQTALKLSPNGIDSNFTYAIYLFEEKQYDLAKLYLIKAKNAPSRIDRRRADIEIKKQIEKGLIEISKRLKNKNQ